MTDLAGIIDDARGVDLKVVFMSHARPLSVVRGVERGVISIKKRSRVKHVLVEWHGRRPKWVKS